MARKCEDYSKVSQNQALLQCDRATNGAEIECGAGERDQVRLLQCDRATNGAEIHRRRAIPCQDSTLQCDRATNGAEMT